MRYLTKDNLKKCIVCGHADDIEVVCDDFCMYNVRCKNCYAHTRWYNTSEEAVDEWQKKNTCDVK